MKRIITLFSALLMLVALVACSSADEQPSQQPEPQSAETVVSTPDESDKTAADPTMLDSFVEDGKIYFDLHITSDSIKDFTLTAGGETFAESKQVPLKADDTVTQNGEVVEGKKFTIYIVRKYEDEGKMSIESFVHVGVQANKLGELLTRRISSLGNSTKVYFAILETVDGWDHDLSPKLNQYLNGLIPSAPQE